MPTLQTHLSLYRPYKNNDGYHIQQFFNRAMTYKHFAVTLNPTACPEFPLQILEGLGFNLACVAVYLFEGEMSGTST